MIDVTTWTAHVTREPADSFLTAMDRRWRDGLASPATACAWSVDRLHALALLHLDRAAHRRRLRARYFAAGTCGAGSHGFTPMSDLIPGDMYGPECVDAVHTGAGSPLAAALAAVKEDPHLLAITVITEQQFAGIDTFDDHAASRVRPDAHGAVLPLLYASADEDEDDAFEREDLLRANGYVTYTVDATLMGDDPIAMHRSLATVLEDVLDEVAHLKADAAARILTQNPLWPLVVVRAPVEWDPSGASAAEGASQRQPRG